LNNIENILLNGTQLILDHVFKLVGFDVNRCKDKKRELGNKRMDFIIRKAGWFIP